MRLSEVRVVHVFVLNNDTFVFIKCTECSSVLVALLKHFFVLGLWMFVANTSMPGSNLEISSLGNVLPTFLSFVSEPI